MKLEEARIFLCYARKDIGHVNELYGRLKEVGFSPWQDAKDILPGEPWRDSLMRALREASFFVTCLSKHSVNKRGMIQVEIKEALELWREKRHDDIYLIPVKLEECVVPEPLAEFQWVNLFEEGGFEKLTQALREGIKKLGLVSRRLRSIASEKLSAEDVKKMLKGLDLYDRNEYRKGKGINHLYVPREINRCGIVEDQTTNLMWQQTGSEESISYDDAQTYIDRLNTKKFAGFYDWRLPTLEEAMSLMDLVPSEHGLFIRALFNPKQSRIWTADQAGAATSWVVNFHYGGCYKIDSYNYNYVRTVRFGKGSITN